MAFPIACVIALLTAAAAIIPIAGGIIGIIGIMGAMVGMAVAQGDEHGHDGHIEANAHGVSVTRVRISLSQLVS